MDNELYDRQIKTYGYEGVKKITESNICIIGSPDGLGTEIIKNLCLSGVNNIYIYNLEKVINNNNYSFDNFKSQNKIFNLIIINHLYDIENYNVVICINKPINQMVEYNNLTRAVNIKFIGLLSYNISGLIFVDAGNKHVVNQINDEIYESVQILNINDNGNIICNGHNYQNNDKIKIFNIQGINIEQFNNEFKINVINKTTFKLLNFEIKLPFTFINGSCRFINEPIIIKHNKFITEVSNKTINNNFDEKIFKSIFNEEKIPNNFNQFQPVVSIMGSIASFEIIKLITNKFIPINQWFTWSENLNINDLYISLNNKLLDTKWLIIGSGAIGCELLKNLAFINVNNIIITDPDIIEKSNLSTQFLFNYEHIGKLKSDIAVDVIKQIRPSLNIISMDKKIGDENQSVIADLLSDDELTGVFNAVDNISTRKFIDNQCFNYLKPLFESGIMGTKGNTQPIIPYITETYNSKTDPSFEKSFPECVINNFPNEITHTLLWAEEQFNIFNRIPTNLQKWLNCDKNYIIFENDNCSKKDINDFTIKYKINNWISCIKYAIDLFNDFYYNNINKLLENFPINNSENILFWSKGKKQPSAILFNCNNELHIQYIYYTVKLFCNSLLIDDNFTVNDILVYIDYVNHNENKIIYTNPLFFNKKNNIHIEWITLASNIRALNYNIPIQNITYTKSFVCKIIPALITTSSLVAGLITIEMIKYVLYRETKKNIIDNYNMTFINLSNNIIERVKPLPLNDIVIAGNTFNGWNKFIHNEDCNLEEFKNKYNKIFKTNISIITINNSIIYASFMNNDTNIQKKLSEIIINYNSNINLTKQNVIFTINSDNSDIELPDIIIKLK